MFLVDFSLFVDKGIVKIDGFVFIGYSILSRLYACYLFFE
jgi:hypothetical protein